MRMRCSAETPLRLTSWTSGRLTGSLLVTEYHQNETAHGSAGFVCHRRFARSDKPESAYHLISLAGCDPGCFRMAVRLHGPKSLRALARACTPRTLGCGRHR